MKHSSDLSLDLASQSATKTNIYPSIAHRIVQFLKRISLCTVQYNTLL